MNLRSPATLLLIVLAALLINSGIFTLAWLLARSSSQPPEFLDRVDVRLVTLPPPETPEPEPIKEPEPPRPVPRLDFTPELVRPRWDSQIDIDVDVVVQLDEFVDASLEGEFIFDAADLDQPPRAILRVPPPYPFKARQREIEGAVQVKMMIATDGSVERLQILAAEPPGLFEDAVRQTVPQWRFEPGRIGGQAVSSWVVTWIRFDLN